MLGKMLTTDNSENTSINVHSFEKNAHKRPGESQDNSIASKKLKVLEDENLESPSTFDINSEWDMSPENFLTEFLLPHMNTENGYVTLMDWLLSINVLKKPLKCKCSTLKARDFTLLHDQYSWVCRTCKVTVSVWDRSVFASYLGRASHGSLSINDALSCILAWCKQMRVNESSASLGVNLKMVSSIYYKCAATVEAYMTKESQNLASFGGDGSVVFIDLRSDGVMKRVNGRHRRRWSERFYSLWIADSRQIPVRYSIHVIRLPNKASLQVLDDFHLFQINLEKHNSSCQIIAVKSEDELDNNMCENRSTGEGDESSKTMSLKSPKTEAQKQRELRVLKEQQDIHSSSQNQEVKVCKINDKSKKSKGKHKKIKQVNVVEISKNEEDKGVPSLEEICEKFDNGQEEALVSKFDATAEQENEMHTTKHLKKDLQLGVAKDIFSQPENVPLDFESKTVSHEENSLPVVKSGLAIESEVGYLTDSGIRDAVMNIVDRLVAPDSLVLANEENIPSICSVLRASQKYKAVMSFSEILAADDTGHTPTSSILDHIWQKANDLSKRINNRTQKGASRIVSLFLWRQYFGFNLSEAAYYILHQIGSHYQPTNQQSSFYSDDYLL